MNRNVGIATGIGIAIIIGVIVFQVNETRWEQTSVEEYYEKDGKVSSVVYPDNPQLLGPLQINKDKYLLGENVYLILKDLKPGDKGSVLIITPENIIFDEWGFNGSEREMQKKYFKPQLLMSKNLCEKEQLVGTWTLMFRGYDMAKINFDVLEDILPNTEHHFEECNVAYVVDPTKQDSGLDPSIALP